MLLAETAQKQIWATRLTWLRLSLEREQLLQPTTKGCWLCSQQQLLPGHPLSLLLLLLLVLAPLVPPHQCARSAGTSSNRHPICASSACADRGCARIERSERPKDHAEQRQSQSQRQSQQSKQQKRMTQEQQWRKWQLHALPQRREPVEVNPRTGRLQVGLHSQQRRRRPRSVAMANAAASAV